MFVFQVAHRRQTMSMCTTESQLKRAQSEKQEVIPLASLMSIHVVVVLVDVFMCVFNVVPSVFDCSWSGGERPQGA